jgi:hypothetical protein
MKGTSAEVQISLRSTTLSGPAAVRPIPLETFAVNKDMGRILIRRGGETIGAGKYSITLTYTLLTDAPNFAGIVLGIEAQKRL